MGVTYQVAKDNSEFRLVLNDAIERYHSRLLSAGAEISILLAYAPRDEMTGEPTSHAVKHNGVPAYAVTRVLSLKRRAYGHGDVEIEIDADKWDDELTARTKVAMLDHELTHIEPVIKDNALQLDDLQRPKIKLRHHDWHFGWFDEVAQRHGKASIESQQARRFNEVSGQTFLDFETPDIDETTPTPEPEDPEAADPLMQDAHDYVVSDEGRTSISALQRHLKVGYNRAARLIEALERGGILSPMKANGQREVLV